MGTKIRSSETRKAEGSCRESHGYKEGVLGTNVARRGSVPKCVIKFRTCELNNLLFLNYNPTLKLFMYIVQFC